MRQSRNNRLAYAGVVALALVVAVGGSTALAKPKPKHKPKHHHYVITSTNQISPSVRNKLHGANGTNGSNGSNGAQGPAGATGATGATGAAGAVAGYFATNNSNVTIPVGGSGNTFVTVVSKVLPAGSYLITTKTSVNATANSGQTGNVAPECDLLAGASDVDSSQAQGPLGAGFLVAAFTATIVNETALTTSSSVTVSLQCENQLGAQTGLAMVASFSQLQAVQTAKNS